MRGECGLFGTKKISNAHLLTIKMLRMSIYPAIIILIMVTIPDIYGQANNSGEGNKTGGSDQNENENEFWEDHLGEIVALSSTLTAVGALIYNIKQTQRNQEDFDRQLNLTKTQFLDQMRANEKATRASTWMTFREMIGKYENIHQLILTKIFINGKEVPWSPLTNEQSFQLNSYMGLFEHCSKMMEDNILDLETFESIYFYRIENILENNSVKERQLGHADAEKSWKEFIKLCRRLHLEDKLPEELKYNKDFVEPDKPELDVSWEVVKNSISPNSNQEIIITVCDKSDSNEKISDAKVGGKLIYPLGEKVVLLDEGKTNRKGQISYSLMIGDEIDLILNLHVSAGHYKAKEIETPL